MSLRVEVDRRKIADFCRKWKIRELAVFGSALREDFGPESDVDVLVTFGSGGGITFDNRPDMIDELSAIFGRPVDLVEQNAIRNPFRRRSILRNREILVHGG